MRALPIALLAIAGAAPLTAKVPPPVLVATGPPVNCVLLQQVRGTRVIDDSTIDFQMSGNRVMRNTLPRSCPRLGYEKAFVYQTSIAQLCSVDIITVIMQGGGMPRGATCGLGKFTPMAAQPETPPAK